MFKAIIALLGILIFQVLSSFWLPSLLHLDLALIATVYFALRDAKLHAALFGSAAGLLEDFLSGAPLGLNGFAKALVGYLVATFNRRLYSEAIASQLIILGLSFLLNLALVWLLLSSVGRPVSLNPAARTQLMIQAGATMLGGLLVGLALSESFANKVREITRRPGQR